MHIRYLDSDQQSDYEGPVLEIFYSSSLEETFDCGSLFEKVISNGLCAWRTRNSIRFPLMEADYKGMAITLEEIIKEAHMAGQRVGGGVDPSRHDAEIYYRQKYQEESPAT